MKKLLLLASVLLLPMKNGLTVDYDCHDKVELNNISSNNIVEYIEKNDLLVIEICAHDYCETVNSGDLENSYEKFINNYHEFLKKTVDEDTYLSIYLKGFKIESIKVNNCIKK